MANQMNTYKLAPVRWELGQILLPEHFTAQHAAMLAEVRLRAAIHGLPSYGVAELSWHAKALEQGQLVVQSLTVLLASGIVVNVPGNATLEGLSLKAVGAPRAKVYLHLLGDKPSAVGNPAYADDPKMLRRELLALKLSTQPSLERSIETLQLAEFEQEPEQRWSLREAYCPPLLQVGSSPFLQQPLLRLDRKLVEFYARLLEQLQDHFLRADRLTGIRSCLLEVCQVRSLLAEANGGVHRHPCLLFDALRRLYFEICAFKEKLPDKPVYPYQHDALGDAFGGLLRNLDDNLSLLTAPPRYFELKRRDGQLVVDSWPDELSRAEKVYLLVSRNQRQEKVPLDEVKLASPERLELVHRAALKGVPFELLATAPAGHYFAHGVEFYELTLGEEWAYAQKARGLAFYITPPLESPDVKVLLYWKLG